jgi:ribose transport system substrate-binding protein
MVIGQGGTPTGLESIREGWLQVTVDYPMSPEYKGMFDFLPKLMAGEKLQAGPYPVDGFENQINMEDAGPVIRIPAEVVTKAGGDGALNVDDPSLWGNVELPE